MIIDRNVIFHQYVKFILYITIKSQNVRINTLCKLKLVSRRFNCKEFVGMPSERTVPREN